MKIEEAQRLGAVCDLHSLGECYSNIRIHAMSYFPYDELNYELKELSDEIKALPEYPDTWESIKTPQHIIDEENAKMDAYFDSLPSDVGANLDFDI